MSEELRICDHTERVAGDWRKPPGPGWTWFSICSAHCEPAEGCGLCDRGQWVNDEAHAREHRLYETDYDEWHRQVNAPGSPARQFLEETFPGLRGEGYKD